jgi:hypothetical protein
MIIRSASVVLPSRSMATMSSALEFSRLARMVCGSSCAFVEAWEATELSRRWAADFSSV